MSRASVLKSVRLLHLYFGVFITPAILFFALTGALQTFGLHETNRDHPDYKPARWIVLMGQLHKKQTIVVPERRPTPPPAPVKPATPSVPAAPAAHVPAGPAVQSSAAPPPASPAPAPGGRHHNLLPMKIFFLVVSLGLFSSTLTGLYMAYTYTRNKTLITLALLAGVALPLLLLAL